MNQQKNKNIIIISLISVVVISLGQWILPVNADNHPVIVPLFQSPLQPPNNNTSTNPPEHPTPIGYIFETPNPNITPIILTPVVIPISLTPPASTPTPTQIPDDTPPQTYIAVYGTKTEHDWYSSPLTVSFITLDDMSGLGITEYQLDGNSTWLQQLYYYPPLIVSDEGYHSINYRSTDKLLNVEQTQTTTLNIDLTPPTATHTLDGSLGTEGDYTSSVIITMTGEDTLSGLDYVETNLNNGGWLQGGAVTVNQAGSHTLTYRAVDLAGNISPIQTVSFILNGYLEWEVENTAAVFNRNNQTWSTLSYLADYQGTGYLKTEPDRDELYLSNGLTTAPEVQYNLTIPITGTYTLWLRGSGANGAGDSVYVSLVEMGQTPVDTQIVSGFSRNQWGWSNRTMSGSTISMAVDTPGLYTLHIWPREDGLRLDQIQLTTDQNYQPTTSDP